MVNNTLMTVTAMIHVSIYNIICVYIYIYVVILNNTHISSDDHWSMSSIVLPRKLSPRLELGGTARLWPWHSHGVSNQQGLGKTNI